jgi:hypothetical protein
MHGSSGMTGLPYSERGGDNLSGQWKWPSRSRDHERERIPSGQSQRGRDRRRRAWRIDHGGASGECSRGGGQRAHARRPCREPCRQRQCLVVGDEPAVVAATWAGERFFSGNRNNFRRRAAEQCADWPEWHPVNDVLGCCPFRAGLHVFQYPGRRGRLPWAVECCPFGA